MKMLCGIALALTSVCIAGKLHAVELLTDGGFEFGIGIPDWELEESVYDQTTMQRRDFGKFNSAEQRDFGPQSGPLALWLRAFVGGSGANPDALTNATLRQTVDITPNESYTFVGWSRFEQNYSGGRDPLDQDGPLGEVSSPTTNTFELAFLDATGAVVGTPVDLDIKSDRTAQQGIPFTNDWVMHTLQSTAPTGAVSARVTADAEQMLWNGGSAESAFYDSFSLIQDSVPGTELLENPGLDMRPEVFDPAYTITEDPGGNFAMPGPTVSTADFANRPDSGGQLGAWLRSFEGDADDRAGATIQQSVEGVAGGEYTFSLWSNFQTNFSGGAAGFITDTMMELAFLDDTGSVIGNPLMLDLKADRESQSGGSANDSMWYMHSLMGTAPAGVDMVRVTAFSLDMETHPSGGQQSAFLDDFSLDGPDPSAGLPGDYNADGIVDAIDYAIWRDNLGAADETALMGNGDGLGGVDTGDYNRWRSNFGASAGGASLATATPEPATIWIIGTLLFGFAQSNRRPRR